MQQLLDSSDVEQETVQDSCQNIEAAMRNFIRLEGHIPSQTYEGMLTNLQRILQSLHSMNLESRP